MPRIRAARSPGVRSRLRIEPNSAMGGAAQIEVHGGRSSNRAQGDRLVIKPALKNEALLADIRTASRNDHHFRMWWLGQSGFLLQWKGSHLLFDPYLSDSL